MIQVIDSFLPADLFKQIQNYCNSSEFKVITVGEKDFLVLETPEPVLPYLQIKGFDMTLSFIRQAHKDFDTDNRIHADSTINGNKTHLARVLYLNNENEIESNGTCFWEHYKWGYSLPLGVPNKEFDRLITEDSEDLNKWVKTDVIHSRPNRLLTYEANLFHSKWPSVISKGKRMVLVCFYTKTN